MDVFFPDFPGIAGQDFTTYKDNNYGRSKDDGIGIGNGSGVEEQDSKSKEKD